MLVPIPLLALAVLTAALLAALFLVDPTGHMLAAVGVASGSLIQGLYDPAGAMLLTAVSVGFYLSGCCAMALLSRGDK